MFRPLLALLLFTSGTALVAQPVEEDAEHRADRLRTEQLNRWALETSPRPAPTARAQRDYEAARRAYEREMIEWRRRVAACRRGDWSACD